MKLKGEKEFAAEKLYDILDNEMTTIVDSNDNIEEIAERAKGIYTKYRLVSRLYNIELELDEYQSLISISNNNCIIDLFFKTFRKREAYININNDTDVDTFIKTSIAFITNIKLEIIDNDTH